MDESPLRATTSLSMADTETCLRDALKAEGFGVLTEVDVQAVMREKISEEVAPYRILGVCNPHLAHRAMSTWKGFGLIAPCHVAIYDEGDQRVVIAFDPRSVPGIEAEPVLAEIAEQAATGIGRAVASLQDV